MKEGDLSHAEVKLVDCATGAARSVLTGNRGTYRFEGVGPGKYNLLVARPGFAVLRNGQEVSAGRALRLDAVLLPSLDATTVALQAAGRD